MKMNMKILTAGFVFSLLGSSFADLILVNNGRAAAEIILGPNPTRSEQLGALELNHHIRLITGTELPVRTAPGKEDAVRIYIGESTSIPCPVREGERIVRKIRGKNIYLTGTDTSSRGKVDYNNVRTFPMTTYQWDYVYTGPLFAVYDFLEDLCGVRFFWLNESGTRYEPRKTLSVKAIDRDHKPPMDAFRVVHVSARVQKSLKISPRERMLWGLRWRHCIHFGLTNHNGYSIYFAHYGPAKAKTLSKAFRNRRPDFFAQGYEGGDSGGGPVLRPLYPDDKSLPPQLCFTNPGVIDYYAREVLTYARGGNVMGGWKNRAGHIPLDRTLIPRFDGQPFFYPIEGADNQSFCKCPACQALNAKTGSVSNSKFYFMSSIAAAVAKQDPGAGVSSLAYINSLPYPDTVKMSPNLSIQLCLPYYTWWHPAVAEVQRREYKKWVENEAKKRVLTLWTYMFSPAWDASAHFGGYKCFPGFYPLKTAEYFKEFVRDGIRGWFSEITDPVNSHLEMYVASRIAYDRAVDTTALINDYFARYYGAAGKYLQEFYRESEQAYWNPALCPKKWLEVPGRVIGPRGPKHPYWTVGLHSPEFNWQLGTPERMKRMDQFIQSAESQKLTPAEKETLERFVKTIWQPAKQGRKDFEDLCLKLSQAPVMRIGKVPAAAGDPLRVAWEKLPWSHCFTDFHGRDMKNTSRIQTASDGTWFYLHFHEDKAPDVKRPHGHENIEVFFAGNREFPVYQLVIGANGTYNSYVREYATEKQDFGAKIVIRPGKNSWDVYLSVPVKNLPFKNGRISANVYRSWDWRKGGASVWSPVYFSKVFIAGLPYFGTMILPDGSSEKEENK